MGLGGNCLKMYFVLLHHCVVSSSIYNLKILAQAENEGYRYMFISNRPIRQHVIRRH